ncbi:MAG: glycosyltransferase, partial [Bryobacterales bacterium]|nr:glycosyltransferase [Bryobacterales bacterium]
MVGPSQGKRLAIAFFPSKDSAADRAFVTLRRRRLATERLTDGSRGDRGSFSDLILPGESLLVAWIEVANLAAAIDVLQAAGARSIFLTPGGMPAPAPDHCVKLGTRFVRTTDIRHSINELQHLVQGARDYLVESVRLGHLASPAAQWVIDNAYLIYLNLTELRKGLPPALKNTPAIRATELLDLAHELVGTDSRVTETTLVDFLDRTQEKAELDGARLWSFPLLVRIALVEQLAALACRSSRVQQLREAAFLWADRLALSSGQPGDLLNKMVARLEAEPFAHDRSFVVALGEQLQDQEAALEVVHGWIASHSDAPLVDLVRSEHEREAADSLLAFNAFNSLKALGQIDFRDVFEAVSRAESLLREDPSGVYAGSDFATRDHARQIMARIARQSALLESEVAQAALQLAKQSSSTPMDEVLYYLISSGVSALERKVGARISLQQRILRWMRRHATGVYLALIFILAGSFVSVAVSLARDAGIDSTALLVLLACLALLPLSELAIQMVHSLVIEMFPPEPLPRMDYRLGIPAEAATLVVVPMMLSSAEVVRSEAEKLEIRYLANRQANLTFALFPDYLDARDATSPKDAVLLEAAKVAISGLNRKYPDGRFVLLHRPRVWSETQQAWIGRERKRGKIEELNALLCGHGEPTRVGATRVLEGALPKQVRFVIALDADTQLPPDVAVRLIETIAHPLNRVHVNPETGIRDRGYGIIQPRVGITLPGASATHFTRVFADAHGTDPYSTVVSDAQQDLFGEGIFHGKAIYDVRAFHEVLGNRFPLEALLSHDLIEGAHVGVGFSSDIELTESMPLDYPGFARRQHRWIRGDWQIASWAGSKVPDSDGKLVPNPLSAINRWRIFDNLRRSLVPVASILLVAFGWFFSVAPGVWSIVLALTVGIPAIVPILDRWTRHIEGSVYGWQGAGDDLRRASVMVTVMPHQAWLALDAIVRVLHRRFVSRRQLLEWQTAEAAETNKGLHLEATMRQLVMVAGVSGVALGMLALRGAFAPTFAYLGVWIAAPWLIRWLAKATPRSATEPLEEEEKPALRALARRTWRFFDELVGPANNWLPPDNSQLALRTEVARRTSPTNIGLWLNAAQAAHDFGYITTEDLAERCGATMATLQKLQRYEGHLLNWYDTQSLEPLLPQYVSTVDSGNLIASLWVFAQGCRDLAEEPLLTPAALAGLSDAVEILSAAAGADPSVAVALQGLSQTLRQPFEGIERIGQLRLASFHSAQLKLMRRWSSGSGDETAYWALKVAAELDSWTNTLDRYLGWMELLSAPSDEIVRSLGEAAVELRREALNTVPSLKRLTSGMPKALAALLGWRGAPELRPEVADWLNSVESEYGKAQHRAGTLSDKLQSLAIQASELADGINMAFVYDPIRRLFGTGYAIGNPVTFESHYDLLASECRVASLVSIAKGDIPIEHWFMLARPRAATATGGPLLSWSGTMFEYLMPLLFLRAFGSTLLATSCREAVDAQIAYGEQEGIPWGISEAAYSALDSNQIYQYRAFGVPSLALNPNADPGPVVAPYATVLALMVRPRQACANLRTLEAAGLAGTMGFYESIDYTRPRRKEDDKPGVPIFTYMAHHQGMSLLALSNVLSSGVVRRRFHADLRIRAIESLLFERVPIARVETEELARPPVAVEASATQERRWTRPTVLPRVHLSSNGRYNLMVTNNGSGYSRWKGFDITRWRSDTTMDSWGSFLWLKDVRSGQIWSPCRQPMGESGVTAGDLGESIVSFYPDRAEFVRRVQDVEAKLEVAVATDDDAELRRLTVTNRSLRTRTLELTSYHELALAPHGADTAHPAFSKMFIETEELEQGVLIARRRLRSPEDSPIWAAAMLTGFEGPVSFETDRRAFIGRGNTLRSAVGLTSKLTGSTGSVLDPIFSFRYRLTLEPRNQRTITFITIAAASREDVVAAVRKYQQPDAAARAFEMIWTRAQLEFRYLRIGAAAAHRYQDLAGHLIFPASRLRPHAERLTQNRLGQSALWKYGISGDRPILVVTVADEQGVSLVREVLLAHSYWQMLGLESDLVILNREATSYEVPLQKGLDTLLHAHGRPHDSNQAQSVFLLNWQSLVLEDQALLLSVARVVLGGHRGPLQQQLLSSAETQETPEAAPQLTVSGAVLYENRVRWIPEALTQRNGLGGFTADGREYVIDSPAGAWTPVPWSNVMSNERFGTLVTESGPGFTWSGNSQMNRLTPWHNDPVSDPQSEVIYLRDDETGVLATTTPLPLRGDQPSRVRHGQGYSVYERQSLGIRQRLTVFTAETEPVKLYILSLKDDSGRARKLTLTYLAEWVLGSVREQQQGHVSTS